MYKMAPPTNENVDEITASIRPNPTTGWFEIEVTFPNVNMAMNVSIYDVSGKLIKDFGKVSTEGFNKVAYKQIDMTDASNGNYYLILNNYNKQLTKQFVKV
jgi:hypothetical protein